MHVQPRQVAQHVGVADAVGGRLVQAGRIAQHALHQMIEDRHADIGQHQAGDRLVDAEPRAQRAGDADPQRARRRRRPPPSRPAPRSDRCAPSGSAATVAARPPSTTAASPPMITRPSWPGSATHSAVSSSGAARCSVFWIENQLPNAPSQISSRKSPATGRAPAGRSRTGHTAASSASERRQPGLPARGATDRCGRRPAVVPRSRRRQPRWRWLHSCGGAFRRSRRSRPRPGSSSIPVRSSVSRYALPAGITMLPLLSFMRALEDGEAALHDLGLHRVDVLASGGGQALARRATS